MNKQNVITYDCRYKLQQQQIKHRKQTNVIIQKGNKNNEKTQRRGKQHKKQRKTKKQPAAWCCIINE